MSTSSPNRLAREKSPYLLQHAHNPVRLVPLGRRGIRQGARGGQADLPLGRLLDLPLVSRHGARVVRSLRHRRIFEGTFRQHQGRPRGASRRRPGLHGLRAGDHRPWRLADERLADTRVAPIRRRHLFSAHRHAGPPRIHHRPAAHRGNCGNRTASRSRTGRAHSWPRFRKRKKKSKAAPRISGFRGILRRRCDSASPNTRGCSTRRKAASGARQNSPARSIYNSSFRLRKKECPRRMPTWPEPWHSGPCAKWPTAACTIISAAVFIVTPSTPRGMCPTSKKMLYDQAQLTQAYLTGYQVSHDDFFAKVARNILQYVEHDLTSPEGGFFSAEGGTPTACPARMRLKKARGAFYIWTYPEILEVLGEDRVEEFCAAYGVEKEGNVSPGLRSPRRARRRPTSLIQRLSIPEAAERFKRPAEKHGTSAQRRPLRPCSPNGACARVLTSMIKSSPPGTAS